MQVQNQKLILTYPFEEYLKLPGFSHSQIKNEGKPFKNTRKMQLGKDVHCYLLEPQNYHRENINIVRPIVRHLQNSIVAPLLPYAKPEVSITADFIHNGFKLPWKGRLDLTILKKVVIDFKVSEMPIKKGIEFFGYDNQLSGYAVGSSAEAAIIVRISPKSVEKGKPFIEMYNVPIKTDWWEYQIVQKGEPLV